MEGSDNNPISLKIKPRSLWEICTQEGVSFQIKLRNNRYCSLAMGTREIVCPYISEKEDHNGLRVCTYHIEN